MTNAEARMTNDAQAMPARRAELLCTQSSFLIRHSGLTLVELLVVVIIVSLLVSSAIPIIAPTGPNRRLREAARGANQFITGAQARAINDGRPFGVRMVKLSDITDNADDNGAVVEMYYVQTPPPFTGLSTTSRVRCGRPGNAQQLQLGELQFISEEPGATNPNLPPGWGMDLFPSHLFQEGDIIEIAGVKWRLGDPNNGTNGIPVEKIDAGEPSPQIIYRANGERISAGQNDAMIWSAPMRYAIHRRPEPTSNPPYQLPEGTAIDLRGSGTMNQFLHRGEDALGAAQIDNPTPVTIMFGPEGNVSDIIANLGPPGTDAAVASPLTDNLFLLVGLVENIPSPNPDPANFTGTDREVNEQRVQFNWLHGDSRWVTVGAQTGAVTTSPNAFVDPTAMDSSITDPWLVRDWQILRARELATQSARETGR